MTRTFFLVLMLCMYVVAVQAEEYGGKVVDFRGSEPTVKQLIEALRSPPPPKYTFRSITVARDKAQTNKVLLSIPFEFNSAKLTPQAQKSLEILAEALGSEELLADRFEIVGHTDGKGTVYYNQILSTKRAFAVKNYLQNGDRINEDRLIPIGKGEFELINREQPFAAENRRVEIVNIGAVRKN